MTLTTEKSVCSIDQDDGLHVAFVAGSRISLQDARAVTVACKTLVGQVPRLAIVDFRQAAAIELAAFRYFFTDPGHLSTYRAVCILNKNALGTLIGRLAALVVRPRAPAHFALGKSAAQAWLAQNDPAKGH